MFPILQGRKKYVFLLIDPDKFHSSTFLHFLENTPSKLLPDIFLVGGSTLISKELLHETIRFLKTHTQIPVYIFPGSYFQIDEQADAILFLSLLSGRNPEYLIGQQVNAAPLIKQIGLKSVATGYLLIDCGNITSVSYISHSFPIPYNSIEVAVHTALAGEMLGMEWIYLDGGSGAEKTIHIDMIKKIRKEIRLPILIGGGIQTKVEAEKIFQAGADIIVIGTLFEKNPEYFQNITETRNAFYHS